MHIIGYAYEAARMVLTFGMTAVVHDGRRPPRQRKAAS